MRKAAVNSTILGKMQKWLNLSTRIDPFFYNCISPNGRVNCICFDMLSEDEEAGELQLNLSF